METEEEEEETSDETYEYTDDETFEDEVIESPEPMKFADQYVPAPHEPCRLTVPMKPEEYAVLGTVERTKLGYP